MNGALVLLALAGTLACPLHALLRVRRGRSPSTLSRREAASELPARQRQLAKRLAELQSRTTRTATGAD